MRNHLVSDVLKFPSLKSLQIKTKYISEKHIKLKQKLETYYQKLTNGQNPVLLRCYWVFCFGFFLFFFPEIQAIKYNDIFLH